MPDRGCRTIRKDSERRQAEAPLRMTAADCIDYKELARAKDDLISAVSHEMRTPLTAMLGYTNILLEEEFSPEQTREYLEIIQREICRLTEMVSNFLDLQRMKARSESIVCAPLEIHPLLEESVLLFAMSSKRHPIRLEAPARLPRVLVGEDALLQVLSNLLSNAIKYSPKGGEVVLGVTPSESEVTLWVRDHGIGIPHDLLGKIFDQFYQVEQGDRRTYRGTGLGLTVVREQVLTYGGRIWVESTAGEGSTFYVSLPVARDPAVETGDGASPPAATVPPPSLA